MIGGDWRYVDDGSPVNFTSWASGQPNNISNFRFCTYMDDYTNWYSQYCNETLNFVCGVPGIGEVNPTVPSFFTTTTLPIDSEQTTNAAALFTVLSTIPETPFDLKFSDCQSYVPFSFDVSKKLALKQFKEMKDFIYNMFSPVILSNDIKPASVSTYGERNYAIKKPESLIETVAYVVGTNEQTADLDSDITK